MFTAIQHPVIWMSTVIQQPLAQPGAQHEAEGKGCTWGASAGMQGTSPLCVSVGRHLKRKKKTELVGSSLKNGMGWCRGAWGLDCPLLVPCSQTEPLLQVSASHPLPMAWELSFCLQNE